MSIYFTNERLAEVFDYGVKHGEIYYFDPAGKATIKVESKPALDTIAQFLKDNQAMNVFIVGHTDGTGGALGWWNWANKSYDAAVTPPDVPAAPYWTQVASVTVFDQASGVSWSTPVAAGNMLVSSNTYRVVAAVVDQANNAMLDPVGAGKGASFRYDTAVPSAAVTGPAVYYSNQFNLGSILGTANDELSGASGLQSVQVMLKLEALNAYWTGLSVNGGALQAENWDTSAGKYIHWLDKDGGTLKSWTKSFPPLPYPDLDSRRFRLWVRATDNAVNTSASPTVGDAGQLATNVTAENDPAFAFVYDNSPGVSITTYPPVHARSIPFRISGTAADTFEGAPGRNPSLVNDLRVRIRRSDGQYWSLGSGQWVTLVPPADYTYFSNINKVGLNPWTFPGFNDLTFQDGWRYTVNPKTIDGAQNEENAYSTYTFIVDQTTPVAKVSYPADGGYAGVALTQIQGTAQDRFCRLVGQIEQANAACVADPLRDFESGIAPSSVTVSIQDISGTCNGAATVQKCWWNGAAWQDAAAPTWSTATFVGDSSGTWTYSFPASKLISPRQYEVSAWVVHDRAGNIQTNITTNTFTFDTTPPASTATFPSGPVGTVTTITGTARDDAPGVLDFVLLRIYEKTCDSQTLCHEGQYWNGTNWQTGEFWVPGGVIGAVKEGTTRYWSFDGDTVDWDNRSDYMITSLAQDKAGNQRTPVPGVLTCDVSFYMETPAPELYLGQPPSPDMQQYRSDNTKVTIISGTGYNLKDTGGVRLLIKRLTEPASYWYDPTSTWGNDSGVYTPLNVNTAVNPMTWGLTLNPLYHVANSSYSLTVTGYNATGQTSDPVTRLYIIDNEKPSGFIGVPAAAACPGAPGVNGCLKQLPTIVGTATDPANVAPPSIKHARLRIKNEDSDPVGYWNGAAFAAPVVDTVLSSTLTDTPVNWSTATLADGSLLDGVKYGLYLWVEDKAGNAETAENAMTKYLFVYDKRAPTAYLVHPSSGEVYYDLDHITGDATDPGGANSPFRKSDVTSVTLKVSYPSGMSCFTPLSGGGFNRDCGDANASLAATGTTAWDYAHANLSGKLTSGATYVVYVSATDGAGNPQSGFGVPASSRTVYADRTAPTAGFTQPDHNAAYKSGVLDGGSAIAGTAYDPQKSLYPGLDALNNVDYVIWYLQGQTSYYYIAQSTTNGTYFSSTTYEEMSWQTPNTTDSWHDYFDGGAGTTKWISDRQYYAKVRARDRARHYDGTILGNLSTPASEPDGISHVAFIVDDTPPVSSMTWPVNGGYANLISSITGTANMALSGYGKVEVSITTRGVNGPYWNGTAWAYSATVLWREVQQLSETQWAYPGTTGDNLTSAFADNTSYYFTCRAQDNAGNQETAPPVFRATLDTTPPVFTVSRPTVPPNLPYYPAYSNLNTLREIKLASGTVSDPNTVPSGVAGVWLAVSSGIASPYLWWNPANGLFDIGPNASIQWAASTNAYSAGSGWQITPPAWAGAAFTDGAAYTVHVRAVDRAGNWYNGPNVTDPNSSLVKQWFKYDTTLPVGSVSVPSGGSSQNTSLAVFSGSAQDLGGGGVRYIYAALQHTDGAQAADNTWWSWTSKSFIAATPGYPPSSGDQYWAQVASTTVNDLASLSWSTPVVSGMLASSNTYRFVVAAIDQANNAQASPLAAGGSSFRYDTQVPLVNFTFPLAQSYNAAGLAAMAGAANDETTGASGLQSVQILLQSQQVGGGLENAGYWNGLMGDSIASWDTGAGKYAQWRTVTQNPDWKSWLKSFPGLTWLDSTRFTLWVRAQDNAGNWSATPTDGQLDAYDNADGSEALQFTYDNSQPSSRVTFPPVYTSSPSLTAISGTSRDAHEGSFSPSLVNQVTYKLKRSDGQYLQALGQWGAGEPLLDYVTGGSINPWYKTVVVGRFEDGYTYDVNSQGRDNAQNYESPYTTYTFTVDLTTPIAVVSTPAAGSFIGASFATVQGTADDRFCNVVNQMPAANPYCDKDNALQPSVPRRFQSGVAASSVTVAVRDMSGFCPSAATGIACWWSGSAWVDQLDPVWSTATFVGDSSGTWSFAFPAARMNSTRNYQISSRVVHDRAGNIQTLITTHTYTFDTTPPASFATLPSGSTGQVTTITGTAQDTAPGELEDVLLSIKETACGGSTCHVNKWWKGWEWGDDSGEVWLASGAIANHLGGGLYEWSFDANTVSWDNRSTYTVTARARDRSGNTKTRPLGDDITFYLETPAAVVFVSQPPFSADPQHYNGLASAINNISGTGYSMRKTGGIRLQLKRLSEPASYWFDSASDAKWSDTASTFTPVDVTTTTNPMQWNYTWLGSPYHVANASYVLTATGFNNAGLPSDASVERTFIFDSVKPSVLVSVPAPAACPLPGGVDLCLNALPTFAGTASDPTNVYPPSVSEVRARLKDEANVKYFDGDNFGAAVIDMVVSSTLSATPVTWSTATLAETLSRMTDGAKYGLYVWAKDKATNAETSEASMAKIRFLYDRNPPVGYLVLPSSGEVYNELTTISGTSDDLAGPGGFRSGVTSVFVKIYKAQSGLCFNGTNFSVACSNGAAFLPVTGTPAAWTYQNAGLLPGTLQDGATYVILAGARDVAGNEQTSFGPVTSSRVVHFDYTPPTAGFVKPVHTHAYRPDDLTGVSAINGTASDSHANLYPGGNALNNVDVLLWYLNGPTSYYYVAASTINGTFFSSTTFSSASWRAAQDTNWNYLIGQPEDWTQGMSDQTFRAMVRARDRARVSTSSVVGNLSAPGVVGKDFISFIVDGTPPVSEVLSPAPGSFIKSLASIKGTSNCDLSGASTYHLRIIADYGGTPEYWDGQAWQGQVKDLPVFIAAQSTGAVLWEYPGSWPGQSAPTLLEDEGAVYGISIQAVDLAGNAEPGATAQVTLDKLGPLVAISTPMGVYFAKDQQTLPLLRGTSSDAPAGVARVEIQITQKSPGAGGDGYVWRVPGWSVAGSSWHVTETPLAWTFSGPPGSSMTWADNKAYTVEVQAFDNANNRGDGVPRDMVYDVNKPSSAILVPVLSQFYKAGQPAILSGTAQDWVHTPATESKSNMSRIQIAILDGSLYWQGTVGAGGFAAAPNYRDTQMTGDASAVVNWSYPAGTDTIPPWEHGKTYTVRSRAVDNSGNVENPETTSAFTYDAQAPAATVASPYDQEYVTAFSSITGSYTEPVPPTESGLKEVRVSVRSPLSTWWDGTGFTTYDANLSWSTVTVLAGSGFAYSSAALTSELRLIGNPRFYTVFTYGKDNAGNESRDRVSPPAVGGKEIRVDFFPPVSVATKPWEGASISTGGVTPISGTAEDQTVFPGVGVRDVWLKAIRIDSLGAIKYWDGSGNWSLDSDPGFFLPTTLVGGTGNVGTVMSQEGSLPEGAFTDGYMYKIALRATDKLANVESAVTTTSFRLDRSTPTAAFNVPTAASVFISSTLFTLSSGPHQETYVGGNIVSSVAVVYVQIQDVSDLASPAHAIPGGLAYWGQSAAGDGWQAGVIESSATVYASSWVLTNLPPNWVRADATPDGRQYVIRVLAKDNAGNRGTFPATQAQQATLVFDGSRPESSITLPGYPDGGITTSFNLISGTAKDLYGPTNSSSNVRGVYLTIQSDPTNGAGCNASAYWTGSAWGGQTLLPTAYNPETGEWQFVSTQLDANMGNDCYYILISSAVDYAGNWSLPALTSGKAGYRRRIYQPPPAETAITQPTANVYYNELKIMQGTCNDNTTKVELQIKRYDTNQCWGGTDAQGWWDCAAATGTRVIYPTGSAGARSWLYPPGDEALPFWINDTTYTFSSRGRNSAGYSEFTPKSLDFYIDQSSPTSTVVYPADSSFVNTFPTITGSVVDPVKGWVASGLKDPSGIYVRIKRLDNGQYWDQPSKGWTGSNVFTSSANYHPVGSTFSYTAWPQNQVWIDGKTYEVQVQAWDKAQGGVTPNVEDPKPAKSFTYDVSVPTATIGSLVAGTTYSVVAVTGTVADPWPGELDRVSILIKDHGTPTDINDPPAYWDGTGWQQPLNAPWPSTKAVITGSDWALANLPVFTNDHFYTIVSSAVDKAGNAQSQQYFNVNLSSFSFFVDTQTPVVGFTYPPNGGYYTNLRANPSGFIKDPYQPNCAGLHENSSVLMQAKYIEGGTTYYFDNVNAFITGDDEDFWFSPLSFTPQSPSSATWTFSNGGLANRWIPGKSYTVSVRGKDDATPTRNFSSSFTLTNFVFDQTAPSAQATGPAPLRAYKTVSLTSGTVTDNFDGVASVSLVLSYYQLSNDTTYYFNGTTFAANAYSHVPAVVAQPGSNSTEWSFSSAAYLTDWEDGGMTDREYRVYAFAADRSGNVQVSGSTLTFFIDNTPPSGTATRPPNGAKIASSKNYYGPANLLNDILGIAADLPSAPPGYPTAKASKVEVQIVREKGGDNCTTGGSAFYWSGSGIWVSDPDTWVIVSGTDNWNYTWAGAGLPAWDDNCEMTVSARATDRVGNVSEPVSQYFAWDNTTPLVFITTPAATHVRTNLPVNGTARDPYSILGGQGKGSGIKDVEVAIRNNSTLIASWWDGDGWDISDTNHGNGQGWIKASTTTEVAPPTGTSFSLPTTTIPFNSGTSYSVEVRAIDRAGNVTAPVATTQFIFDNERPNVAFTNPPAQADLTLSNLPIILGDADDAVDLHRVELRIRRNDTEAFWQQGTFPPSYSINNPDLAWFGAAGTLNWSSGTWNNDPGFEFFSDDVNYSIHARAIDKAGNESLFAASTFTFTTKLPMSYVVTPATYALSAFTNIAGTAFDSTSTIDTSRFYIGIQRHSDNKWFDGTSFSIAQANPFWRQVVGMSAEKPYNWTYVDLSQGKLDTGVEYHIVTQSSNTAGKVEGMLTGWKGNWCTFPPCRDRIIVFDQAPPDARVVFPSSGAVLSALAQINGTAGDQNPGAGISGISSVTVSMQEAWPVAGAYWDKVAGTFTLSTERFWPVDNLNPTGGNAYNWSITSLPAFASGKIYRIRINSVDDTRPTANVQTEISSRSFAYETSFATITILYPANNSYQKGVASISGTAEDIFGVKVASLAIREYGGAYWDGSTYTFVAPQWFTAQEPLSGGPVNFTWSFSSDTFRFQDNRQYEIRVRITNNAGLTVEGNANTFTYDDSPPSSDITAPTRQSHPANANTVGFFLNKLTSVTGTAADPNTLRSGVQASQISLRDTSNNQYWDGTGWFAYNPNNSWRPTSWEGACGAGKFCLASGLPPVSGAGKFETGRVYELKARALDVAGNVQTSLLAGATFMFDLQAPLVAVNAPVNDVDVASTPTKYLNALNAIAGTADDNNNIARVEYRFFKEIGAGGQWWHNSAQSNPGFNPDNTEDDSWQVSLDSAPTPTLGWGASDIPSFPGNPGRYKVNTRAFDSAGNVLTYSTASFTFDDVRPVSKSSSVADGHVVNSLTAVYGTASDGNGVSAISIKLERSADNKCWNWQTPGTFTNDCSFFAQVVPNGSAPDYTWVQNLDFPPPNNTSGLVTGSTYTVTTRAKDVAENFESALSTYALVFDNLPPVVSVATPAPAGYYASQSAAGNGVLLGLLSGPISDTPSGVAPNIDNSTWGVRINILDTITNQWFNGSTFTILGEPFPAYVITDHSGWTDGKWYHSITNPEFSFADGHTYRIKIISRDNVNNYEDQATKPLTSFLIDNTFPQATAMTPGGIGNTEVDTVILSGQAEDVTPPVGGLSQSSIAAATDVLLSIRQTLSFTNTSPKPEDYYWDGSAWVLNNPNIGDAGAICTAPGVPANCRWVPASTYNPATHGWTYTKLGGDEKWPRGSAYFVRVRARDRAGNLVTPTNLTGSGYYFKVAAPAATFLVQTSQGPYTAGTAKDVTVTAYDDGVPPAVASNFTGKVIFSSPDIGAPESPNNGLPADYTFQPEDNGVHLFPNGLILRKAGTRAIKVEQSGKPAVNGTIGDIVVNPDVPDRLVLALPGQTLAPGTSSGRSGAVSISTAGVTFSAYVYVTDTSFNVTSSSAPPDIRIVHNDPYAASIVSNTWNSGVMNVSVTMRSKRGNWEVPGATPNTTLSVSGAGTVGAWNTATLPVQANTASPSKNLLLRLPGETLVPGSAVGKANDPAVQQAASTFTATVYACDEYFNPFEPTQGQTPQVWMEANTEFAALDSTKTLVLGSTTYDLFIKVASSNTWLFARTDSAGYVESSTRAVVVPKHEQWILQLLLPNQVSRPGSLSGTSGSVVPLEAGVTYYATVNLTDQQYNIISATSSWYPDEMKLKPMVRAFFSDANMLARGFIPALFKQQLDKGTKLFQFIPVTRTCPACVPALPSLTLRVEDTEENFTNYITTTTSNIQVLPGPVSQLQLLLPGVVGETASEGSLTGKTGSAGPFAAGNNYQYTVRATDNYWNRTTDGRKVALETNDPFATLPTPAALGSGQLVSVDLIPRSATTSFQVSAVDWEYDALTTQAVSGIAVAPKPFDKLMVLLPEEVYQPGKSPYDQGSTGGRTILASTTVPAGAPFTFTVRGVDPYWNTVDVSSDVTMTASDTLATLPTPTLALVHGVTTFTYTPVRIGGHTVSATTPGVYSSTSNVFTVVGARLSVLVQGETPKPGDLGTEGRQGQPDGDLIAPDPQEFTAGVPFNLTVRLTNWNFYPLPSGSPLTLTFHSDDPNAVLPSPALLDADGESAFSVTLASASGGAGSKVWVTADNPDILSSTSTAISVIPNAPAKLIALARGMSLLKGNPTGFTGAAASTVAGHDYPIDLQVTDAWFNPVTLLSPTVKVSVSDPYVPAIPDQTVTGGRTTIHLAFRSNTVVDPIGGPWQISFSTADGSPLSSCSVSGIVVNPNQPYQFQVLVPTETAIPGNLDLLGRTTAEAAPEYAGSTFTITVNLVDQFFNRVLPGYNSTFRLSSDDPNHKLAGFGNFTTNNGQTITTHTYLVTQSTVAGMGWTITASTATGDTVQAGSSSRFLVHPSTPAKLVIVLPGQERADGIGVSSAPLTQIAGENIYVTIFAVDPGFNYTDSVQKANGLKLTSNDGFAQSSWTLTMVNGIAVATVTLRTSGVRSLSVIDTSGEPPLLAGITSSTFTLIPSNPYRFRVRVPNEYSVPGSTNPGFGGGRGGSVPDQPAGSTMTITVEITDSFWNLTSGASQQVRIVPTDEYATVLPSTLTVVGMALVDIVFKRAMPNQVRAEMLFTPPPWGDSIATDTSSVVNVTAGLPKNLLLVLPGEDFDPGSANGKRGAPRTDLMAGDIFYPRAAIVDRYNNLVPGRAADIRLKEPAGFPFTIACPTAPINTSTGKTDETALAATLVAAATWHQLIAEDYGASGLQDSPYSSTFTVNANDPYGLQLLLPGETNMGGLGVYPDGGKVGSISTQTAGVPIRITVNLVDRYNNIAIQVPNGPNVYLVTSDTYDVEPPTAPLASGSLKLDVPPNAVTLVTKSTAASIAVYPRDQLVDHVCQIGELSVECRAESPAARTPRFKVFASTGVALQVLLPGEKGAPGKCTVSPYCQNLAAGDTAGKTGAPTAFAMTVPQTAFQATVNLVDAFFNVATEISSTSVNWDTNPPALMPEVVLTLPADSRAVPPSPALLQLGNWTFPIMPVTAMSTYSVVASSTPASLLSVSSAASAALDVHPGPAHHLHFHDVPSSARRPRRPSTSTPGRPTTCTSTTCPPPRRRARSSTSPSRRTTSSATSARPGRTSISARWCSRASPSRRPRRPPSRRSPGRSGTPTPATRATPTRTASSSRRPAPAGSRRPSRTTRPSTPRCPDSRCGLTST